MDLGDDWKLQVTNVCFGAKDDSYGNFTLTHTGTLTKLKLQHKGEGTLNSMSFSQPLVLDRDAISMHR